MKRKTMITGVKPTCSITLVNYIGGIKSFTNYNLMSRSIKRFAFFIILYGKK